MGMNGASYLSRWLLLIFVIEYPYNRLPFLGNLHVRLPISAGPLSLTADLPTESTVTSETSICDSAEGRWKPSEVRVKWGRICRHRNVGGTLKTALIL
jgi:hypothetical protein